MIKEHGNYSAFGQRDRCVTRTVVVVENYGGNARVYETRRSIDTDKSVVVVMIRLTRVSFVGEFMTFVYVSSCCEGVRNKINKLIYLR